MLILPTGGERHKFNLYRINRLYRRACNSVGVAFPFPQQETILTHTHTEREGREAETETGATKG